MDKPGVTLLELLIVVIIIGVLSTLATVSYTGIKEDTVDKEAKANLRLILAAQRIYRMEIGGYYASGVVQPTALTNINANLRLLLSAANNRNWNYITTATAGTACCGQATRTVGARTLRIRNTETDPVAGTCP